MNLIESLTENILQSAPLLLVELFIISILTVSFVLPFKSLNFEWVNTKYQILNFLLLAPIGYTITSSISSNIALSLGMVGALSIIRFRTPVKNSFELVVYFLLLTVGITASVELTLSIVLTIFVHLICWIFKFFIYMNPKFNFIEFSNTIDHSNFLTIESTEEINYEGFNLVSLNYSNNFYEYTISGSKDDLIKYQKNLINSKNINIEKINSSFYN
jgi:hypothetical protein|tara:strand:- start:700 stop:1347 length:648 start_codon:yes stop_codon:yes gene_type:complete